MKSLIFSCLIIYAVLATRGIDISQPGSSSFFSCAKVKYKRKLKKKKKRTELIK
jgi:hypothetical protein